MLKYFKFWIESGIYEADYRTQIRNKASTYNAPISRKIKLFKSRDKYVELVKKLDLNTSVNHRFRHNNKGVSTLFLLLVSMLGSTTYYYTTYFFVGEVKIKRSTIGAKFWFETLKLFAQFLKWFGFTIMRLHQHGDHKKFPEVSAVIVNRTNVKLD